MIEVSLTEIALFIWAAIATGMWFQTREELHGAKRFLRAMIEDEEVRTKVIAEFKTFKEKQDAA